MAVTVNCDNCGDETEKWPAEIERTEHVYCSPECSAEGQTTADPESTTCDWCGDEIDRSPSQIGRHSGGGAYCDLECFGKSNRDESNPTEVECGGCGDPFTIPEARVGFDNFCSEECREEYGKTCPECGQSGFKSTAGVKMHFTRVHDDRYDVARLEEKYGVPVPWLLRTLHWTLGLPIYEVADRLDVGRDWVKERLLENGDDHRTVANGTDYSPHTPIRAPNGETPESLIAAVRHALSAGSWPRQSKRIRTNADSCRRCGEETPTGDLQAHHIIPVRYGGTNDDWNLIALCRGCHPNVEGYTVGVLEEVL